MAPSCTPSRCRMAQICAGMSLANQNCAHTMRSDAGSTNGEGGEGSGVRWDGRGLPFGPSSRSSRSAAVGAWASLALSEHRDHKG
jgi:hypothetical protein